MMVADTDIISCKRTIEHMVDARIELDDVRIIKFNGLSNNEIDDISKFIEWLDLMILVKTKMLNRMLQEIKEQHNKMLELIIAMQIDPTSKSIKDLFSEKLWEKIQRGPYIPDVIFHILKGHWNGKSDREIADELHISTSMVKRWIRDAEKDGFFDCMNI